MITKWFPVVELPSLWFSCEIDLWAGFITLICQCFLGLIPLGFNSLNMPSIEGNKLLIETKRDH